MILNVSLFIGGLILVPSFGPRISLLLGSILFILSPILTYVCLIAQARLETFYLVYGVLSSSSMALLSLVTMVLPVTWFPNKRGVVIGFIASGFGLSSTVFSPMQTALVNPFNVPPEISNSTSTSYFTDEEVLGNVPLLMLYLAGGYALLLIIGFILSVENPESESNNIETKISIKLKNVVKYFWTDLSGNSNFYLLWLTR